MDATTECCTDSSGRGNARVPGLDLLRASAILAVLLFHLASREATSRDWPPPPLAVTLGYLGVELFFILSGFLIGRILIRVAEGKPGYRDWLTFLCRRWMRTLPLYFLWLAILLVTFPPAERVIRYALLYSTFTQSLAWPFPPDGWFGVSWSLSVEEWFYLLFSLVLMTLVAARVRNAIPVSCLIFLTLPLAARMFLISPAAPFDAGLREISFVRLDAIGYGVVVAWAYTRAPDFLAKWQGWFFLAGCVVLLAPIDLIAAARGPSLFATLRPFLFNFTSIGFALWIPAAVGLPIRRGWFDAAVRWLSERSYCLYIVHLSIIDVVWDGTLYSSLPMLLRTPVAVAISVGLAELSFRFLETPILRLRPNQFGLPAKAKLDSIEPQGQPLVVTRASRLAG